MRKKWYTYPKRKMQREYDAERMCGYEYESL